MNARHFVKNSIIYTVAGTLPMASAVILLPFYVTHLSTEVFGAFAIYQALSMLVQILVTFSFDTSLYVHYHDFKTDKEKLSLFVSSCFNFMALLGGVVIGMSTLVGDFFFTNFFNGQGLVFFPYGILSVLTGVFQAWFKVNISLFQTRELPTRFLWSNLINFSLIASLTIVGLKLYPNSLAGPVGARAIAALVSGLVALRGVYREFGMRFNYNLIQSVFNFNVYAFIYQLQLWAINYFDRILMVFFLPIEQIGIYDFALKCMLVLEFVISGLFNSFYPRVIDKLATQERKGTTIEINRYYHGLTAVAVILLAGSLFLFPVLFLLFGIKSDYRHALAFMPYIGLLYLLRPLRLYFFIPYSALKYTRPLPVYYLIITGFKIGLMVATVPIAGVYGVIMASVGALIAEILLLYAGSRGMFDFNYFNVYKMVFVPVVFAVIILLVEFSNPFINQHIIHAGYLIAGILLLLWIYRNELRLINPLRLLS